MSRFWDEFKKTAAMTTKNRRVLTGMGLGALAGAGTGAYAAKDSDDQALAAGAGGILGAILGGQGGLAYNLYMRPASKGRGPIKQMLRKAHTDQDKMRQHQSLIAENLKAVRKELREKGYPLSTESGGMVQAPFGASMTGQGGENFVGGYIRRRGPATLTGRANKDFVTPGAGVEPHEYWENPKFTKKAMERLEPMIKEALTERHSDHVHKTIAHNKANQMARKSVHITYRKENGRVVKRRVDPLEVKKDNLLMAYDHKRKALRSFRMDRVQHVKKAFEEKAARVNWGTLGGGVLGAGLGGAAGHSSDVLEEDKKEMALLGALVGGVLGAAGGYGMGQLHKAHQLPKRMEEAAQRIRNKVNMKMTAKIEEAAKQMKKDQAVADAEAKGVFALLSRPGKSTESLNNTIRAVLQPGVYNSFDPAMAKAEASEKLYNTLIQKKQSRLDSVSKRLEDRFKKFSRRS